MANMTIDDAILACGEILDDPGLHRWTTTQVQAGLKTALSRCLLLYQEDGGDRFDLEATVTTSAVDGSADLSALVPATVIDVGVVTGNITYQIPAKNKLRRGYTDAVSRSLLVLYTQEYALSTTTTHPLVGVGATAANSWPDFDDWVCAQASLRLAIKDLEGARLAAIQQREQDTRMTVLGRNRIPGGYPWPRREWSPFYEWLSWQWKPSTNKINTVKVAW